MQALRCVEYRLPTKYELSNRPLAMALGLRYGLVGCSTAYHLLMSENPLSEGKVKSHLTELPAHLASHIETLPPAFRARLAGHERRAVTAAMDVLELYVPQYRWLFALDLSLSMIIDQFCQINKAEIAGGGLFGRMRSRREFMNAANESFGFALSFFERRLADLDELPEIALLGE